MSELDDERSTERETLPPFEAHDTLPPGLLALDEAAARVFASYVGPIVAAQLAPLVRSINQVLELTQEVSELKSRVAEQGAQITLLRKDVDTLAQRAAE